MVPGALSTVRPCLTARPERGRTCASVPGGSAMAMPVGTNARAPGASVTRRVGGNGGEQDRARRHARSDRRAAAGPRRAATLTACDGRASFAVIGHASRLGSRPTWSGSDGRGIRRHLSRAMRPASRRHPPSTAAARPRRRRAVTSSMVLRSPPMMPVAGDTSLARIQSQPLRLSFSRALAATFSVSAAKPITSLAAAICDARWSRGCRDFPRAPSPASPGPASS